MIFDVKKEVRRINPLINAYCILYVCPAIS